MSAPYSLDLRERVLAAARDDRLSPGLSPGEVAARFRVASSTVRDRLRRARETGRVAAKPHGGGMPPKVDAAGAPGLEALVEDRNERTLAEWAAAYRERTGTALSIHAVRRACNRLDLRRKQKEPGRRRAGAGGRGRRARGAVPAGQWRRLTILGGPSLAGLVACMTVDAAADTDVLVAFTREVLVPALRPGQVVVLDDLSAQKAPAVRRLIERAGCALRFLPPYSPDLTPIEAAWSKLKQLLRGVGARTVDALNAARTTLADAITADDARGYFRHCGYDPR